MLSSSCNNLLAAQIEKIFKGLEYDTKTKEIFQPCAFLPIGKVVMGKIKWNKKRVKALC